MFNNSIRVYFNVFASLQLSPGDIYVGEDTSALETLGMHYSVLC